MFNAIQQIEECRDEAEAREVFAGLAIQDGCLGGRILPPSNSKPGWRVQVFYEDVEANWLPDGLRRVFVPRGLWSALSLGAGQ